jgi:hypothetical protein
MIVYIENKASFNNQGVHYFHHSNMIIVANFYNALEKL